MTEKTYNEMMEQIDKATTLEEVGMLRRILNARNYSRVGGDIKNFIVRKSDLNMRMNDRDVEILKGDNRGSKP